MHDRVQQQNKSEAGRVASEWIWLCGQPSLQDYLDLVRDKVVDGADADPRALADEWRAANDYYYELATSEEGIADDIDCRELDPALAPLADEVRADYRYQRTFDTLPTTIEMVEVERLIAYQRHATRQFVDGLAARLGPAPDAETLFRFCLPLDNDNPPFEVQRVGSRRFIFRSESTDFRAHKAALLRADQLGDFTSFGPIAGMVGFPVGFGSNFLNAIRADDRLVLHNGYHRACALKALGITHAPCIVQTVTRLDELNVVATSTVAEEPAFYYKSARPPLIKDFFDPRIRKYLPMRRIQRIIEVKFEVQDYTVAE